jgi:hypothetical protein
LCIPPKELPPFGLRFVKVNLLRQYIRCLVHVISTWSHSGNMYLTKLHLVWFSPSAICLLFFQSQCHLIPFAVVFYSTLSFILSSSKNHYPMLVPSIKWFVTNKSRAWIAGCTCQVSSNTIKLK